MNPSFQILDYLNAIFRYRLVAVCALLVGLAVTVRAVRVLPDVYQSTTLIMVEPQDVPESYVKATVTTKVEQRLNALNQEVLSRTRLEAIIKDFSLFPELHAEGAPPEKIIETMRNKIQIQVFPRDNAFRISYSDHDPRVAQQVTARLAGLYIDENLRIREEHVNGTTEFLENELQKVGRQLAEQEGKIQDYKQAHMGELPEQTDANSAALGRLNVQLQTIAMALSSAMERKLLLEKQAAAARSFQPIDSAGKPSAEDPRVRLQLLEAQLSDLRSRYTDKHPDVVRTQRQIDSLRQQLSEAPSGGSKVAIALPAELLRALTDVQIEISRLQKEKAQAEADIKLYQQRVENSFSRQQDLLNLTRDYDVTKKTYQSLLDKKLEAELSESLEQRQKGERFRVLDPASLPKAPFKPNRPLLLGAGAAVSLGLALLLPILLWQLDTSFHTPEEIAAYSLPVLAVIPQAPTADIRKRHRRYYVRVVALTSVALVVGLGGLSFYAHYIF